MQRPISCFCCVFCPSGFCVECIFSDRKETEWQKILTIAENNKFPLHHITKLKRYTQHKTHVDKTHDKNKK